MSRNDLPAPAAPLSMVENAISKYSAETFAKWGMADAFAAGYAEGRVMADVRPQSAAHLIACAEEVLARGVGTPGGHWTRLRGAIDEAKRATTSLPPPPAA